ncbi:hypothetical protein JCM33774_31150 [Actinophytocola sp. KF-1]
MISLAGALTWHTAPRINEIVRDALRRRPLYVLVELTHLDALDSPGLAALLTAAHTVALSDGRLRVIAAPDHIGFDSIVTAGLTRRLALRTKLSDALAEE